MSREDLHIIGDVVVGLSPLVKKNSTEADLEACIEVLKAVLREYEVQEISKFVMPIDVSRAFEKLPEHIKERLK